MSVSWGQTHKEIKKCATATAVAGAESNQPFSTSINMIRLYI